MEPALNIESPKKVKIGDEQFFVLNNANPKPLVPPKGCKDALEAECIKEIDLEGCMSKCAENKDCGFGYYIKEGKESVCVPLYTGNYFPEANPVYYVKPKTAFPFTKKATTATFIRDKWMPNGELPNDANAVFMDDIVRMSDTFGNELALTKGVAKLRGEGTDIKIQSGYPSLLLDKVNFGNFVSFIQGDQKSSIVLQDVERISLEGAPYRNWKQTPRNKFQILPANQYKFLVKGSKVLSYGEPFVLRILDQFVVSDKRTKTLKLLPDGLGQWGTYVGPTHRHDINLLAKELLDKKQQGLIFTFKPRKKVYYCDKGLCKDVHLSDKNVKTDGERATYKGFKTMIHPKCYYSCEWGREGQLSKSAVSDTAQQNGWRTATISVSVVLAMVLVAYFILIL